MKEQEYKTVLITGGANGLGYEFADLLTGSASDVVLLDIDGDALDQAKDALGGFNNDHEATVHTYQIDITDYDAVSETVDEIRKEIGNIQMVINNAGIAETGEFEELTFEQWKRCFAINTLAPLNLMNETLSDLKDNDGNIVNISSGLIFWRAPGWAPYLISKLAFAGLSEQAQIELTQTSVSIHTVYPTIIRGTNFYNEATYTNALYEVAVEAGKNYFSTTPENAANAIMNGVNNGQERIYPGPFSRFAMNYGRLHEVRDLLWQKIAIPLFYGEDAPLANLPLWDIYNETVKTIPGLNSILPAPKQHNNDS